MHTWTKFVIKQIIFNSHPLIFDGDSLYALALNKFQIHISLWQQIFIHLLDTSFKCQPSSHHH